MLDDVQAIADFYATARGQVVARLLRRHLAALWPDLSGQTLLGLGFSTPFLGLWRHQALVCIDGMTSAAGATVGADCLLQDDLLPFPTLSVGRIRWRTPPTRSLCCGRLGGCCGTTAGC